MKIVHAVTFLLSMNTPTHFPYHVIGAYNSLDSPSVLSTEHIEYQLASNKKDCFGFKISAALVNKPIPTNITITVIINP